MDIITSKWSAFRQRFGWMVWLIIAAVIFTLIYLAWCRWGPQPAKPGSVIISAPPAPAIAQMETKTVYVPQLVVVKDKPAAVKKLGLPASEAFNPKEELLTSTAVQAARYGSKVTTFVNISTGKARTDVTINESPWFSFERGNIIGTEAGIGLRGQYYQADYQRDIFQIKGVYVSVKGTALAYPQSVKDSDLRAGVRVDYRW